jgi:hypothetical protein
MASKKHPCTRKTPPAWCGKTRKSSTKSSTKASSQRHPCARPKPPAWCNKKRGTRGVGCPCAER